MNRPVRPLEKLALAIVYGLALMSALATLAGAIHPLAAEPRQPRRLVQAAQAERNPMPQPDASTSGDSNAGRAIGSNLAPARH